MAPRNGTGINKSRNENEVRNTTTLARRATALAGLITPCCSTCSAAPCVVERWRGNLREPSASRWPNWCRISSRGEYEHPLYRCPACGWQGYAELPLGCREGFSYGGRLSSVVGWLGYGGNLSWSKTALCGREHLRYSDVSGQPSEATSMVLRGVATGLTSTGGDGFNNRGCAVSMRPVIA